MKKSRQQRKIERLKSEKRKYLFQEKRKNKYQKIFAYIILAFGVWFLLTLFF